MTASPSTPTTPAKHRRNWKLIAFLVIVVIPITGLALWTWGALTIAYSKGERAGYVQKISRKGYVCPTWEGELAMANLPGTLPQIFNFSVRNDSIAGVLKSTIGQRVSISYEEHRGVPTSCFAETPYYVVGVQPVSTVSPP
jgi:hypothetical protein